MTTFKNLRALCATSIAAVLAFSATAADASTSFLLKADNGDFVYGRTMEFALPLHSKLMVVPRNLDIQGIGPDGKDGSGLNFKTKYAATGMNGLDLPDFVDGINEKGLVAGVFNLPGFTEFSPASDANRVASATLRYAVNGGAWQSTPMSGQSAST